MDTRTDGHPAQVFELPAGTRYVVVPPRSLSPSAAEQLMEAIRHTDDPRSLLFGEPGWAVHAIVEAPIVPLRGERLTRWVRDMARRYPRNVQLDPVAR